MGKGRGSYTIDSKILKQFNDFCEKNSINKSNLIEKKIVQILKERGVTK